MNQPLISCLLPTFGRFPKLARLVNEAVQCFRLQDYQNKELIICNDDPSQELILDESQIRVVNVSQRFATLGDKLRWMLHMAQGEYICRWDDDDVSLPWRLSYSVDRLMDNGEHLDHGGFNPAREWRPENHWYYPNDRDSTELKLVTHPGNTHIMAIWHRRILGESPYPGQLCVSGIEDQTFTTALRERGYPYLGDKIPADKIFYLYRWGTGSNHLSGQGGGERMEQNYRDIGNADRGRGRFAITPGWQRDYTRLALAAAARHIAQ